MGSTKRTDREAPLAAHPEPECNTGYAEHEPASPADAKRGGKPRENPESGGLTDDHAATGDHAATP